VRILLVEDELKVARALQQGLTAEGYDVTHAGTGEEAFYLLTTQSFDFLLLDWMLPGRSGMEVLGELRKRDFQAPILVLTAKDAVEDRVTGLDAGADDYLVKPFAFPELLARIRALSRRGRIERAARRAGRELDLTAREFDLLEYLMRYQGQTVSREMLARDVWHVAARATPIDNVIDVHVARLRKKIDDPFETRLLRTIRGVGFLLGGEPE
jgi:DNA-binding response OmpR family regulator